MQHVFDTNNFSLNYVKQILGLFTRLCIFCNLIFLIWSKILIKLKSRGEILIGPNPYLDHWICINCSNDNVAKGIRLLAKKAFFVYTEKNSCK